MKRARHTVDVVNRRPELQPIAPPAAPDEAAAIVAALERFAHDTAPSPAGGGEVPDPWTRAARLEGVMREEHPHVPHPWINP